MGELPKDYDQSRTREPAEPREIGVEIDRCTESALVRFVQEEVGMLSRERLLAIALVIAAMSDIRKITLEGDEIAEFERSCKPEAL